MKHKRNLIRDALICVRNYFFTKKYPFWKLDDTWYDYNTSVNDNRKGTKNFFVKYNYTWYDDIPYGWQKAFGKQLSNDILKAGKRYIAEQKKLGNKVKWSDIINFQQIKEKFGELRIYASTASDEIEHIIDRYCYLSTFYCISCGKPAGYVSSGWIEYYCKACFLKDLHRADDYRSTPLTKEDEENALTKAKLTLADVPSCTRYETEILAVENFASEEDCKKRQHELYNIQEKSEGSKDVYYRRHDNEDGTWSLEHVKSIKIKVDIEKEYNINFKELLGYEEEQGSKGSNKD